MNNGTERRFTVFEMGGREYWFAGDLRANEVLAEAIPAVANVTRRPRANAHAKATAAFEPQGSDRAVTISLERVARYSQSELDAMGAGSLTGFDDGRDLLEAALMSIYAGGAP